VIQNDQEQQQASWNVVNNRKKTTEGRNTPAHNPVGTKNVKAKESVQQKNQYTALSISEVDDSESDSNNVSDNRSDDITATQVRKQELRHERNRHSKGCIPVTPFFIRAYTHVKVEFALHPTYEITKFIKGQHSVLCMI
jgi:hypothetical protein